MKLGDRCKDLANEIILDYDLPIPRVTNASSIDQQVLLQAFKAIIPVDPFEEINGQNDQSSVYQGMVKSLSKALDVDLSHISPTALAAGDLKHILSFLEILVAIKRFLLGNVHSDQLDFDAVELEDFGMETGDASESPSASCSICFCHESTVKHCNRVDDCCDREKVDEHKSKSHKQSRSPKHRLVDARKKKKLLLASKLQSTKQLSKNASPSSSSTHQLARRLSQALNLNEEVKSLESKVSTKCNADFDQPNFLFDLRNLSPGTRIQLERLYQSHQAFQRNIRSQVEKEQDARQLLLEQSVTARKTRNSSAPAARGPSTTNHQASPCHIHHTKSETSMSCNLSCPSHTGTYERDLRSRLARLTQEIKERERRIVSRNLKSQSQLQRHLVKAAKVQVTRSKKELLAAREYVLQRTRQQVKQDQIYLQSLEQLYQEKTDLLCARIFQE